MGFTVEGLVRMLPRCRRSSEFQNSARTPAIMTEFWGALVNELQYANISLLTSVRLSAWHTVCNSATCSGRSFAYFVFGIFTKLCQYCSDSCKNQRKTYNSHEYLRTYGISFWLLFAIETDCSLWGTTWDRRNDWRHKYSNSEWQIVNIAIYETNTRKTRSCRLRDTDYDPL